MLSDWLMLGFLLFCTFEVLHLEGSVTVLNPDCSNNQSDFNPVDDELCSLDDTLENVGSDTVLELWEGYYSLKRSHLLTGLVNVKIVGYKKPSMLICEENGGMAFVNVQNFTIASLFMYGCTLNASVLEDATKKLQLIVNMWFVVPSSVHVGLFIGYGQNVNLTDVTIFGTKGIGILAINIMGKSYLSSMKLTQNTHISCAEQTSNSGVEIGGGAYFAYFDFHDADLSFTSTENLLEVSNSTFANNTDCSSAAQTYVNYRFFERQYMIGGGGGLSIVYAHSSFALATNIVSTIFEGNDARYGGGAHVATFANFSYANSVSFTNCTFFKNGRASKYSGSTSNSTGGAGLAVFSDLFKPSFFNNPITAINNISILVKDTKFENNIAEVEGGGMYAHSVSNSPHDVYNLSSVLYSTILWQLENVTFVFNAARLVAAAAFRQRTFYGTDGAVLLMLNAITVKHSYSLSSTSYNLPYKEVYSAMSVQNVAVRWKGSSLLVDNQITALSVVSTSLFCQANAELVFKNNKGYRGGALFMEGYAPAFVIDTNVSVVFSENTASLEGGAVYFSSPRSRKDALEPAQQFGCFIATERSQSQNFFDSNNTIVFYENRAPVGSSVFGAALEFCPWARNINTTGNIFQELHDNYNSTFIFSKPPVMRTQVSTYAFAINVTAPVMALPGETVGINITVYDRYRNDIFSIVTTDRDPDSTFAPVLGDSGYWFTILDNPTVQIFGPQNTSSPVSYFTYVNSVTATLEVSLQVCPAGFDFIEEQQACVCSKMLRSAAPYATCDNKSLTITVAEGYWLGMDLSDYNSRKTEDLIFHICYSDFCKGGTFRPPDYDTQCGNDSMRTGVMCGACKEGYSVTFGLKVCKKCSNYNIFLFLAYALIGIVLFVVIAFFGFTVDKGWIYAILYYSNLVILYPYHTMPLFAPVSIFFKPIASLSLVGNVDVCFYSGMNAIHRAFIDLALPIYLYVLILVFGLLAQKFSISTYFSPAKTFVTLNIISYVDLLRDTVIILSGIPVSTLGGLKSSRWLEDPNQVYFNGEHIAVGLTAYIIALTLLIGFPILLLFPKSLYKYRIFKGGMPFYDALYAPYEYKLRSWLGIRIIVLCVVSLLVQLRETSISLFLNGIILLATVHIQVTLKPYKNYWLNMLDSYFIVMVLFLLIGSSSLLNSDSVSIMVRIFYGFITVIIPLLFIMGVLLYHLDLRFPKIRQMVVKVLHKVRAYSRNESTHDITPPPAVPTTSEVVIHGDIRSTRFTNSHYRETLFETIQL